MGAVADFFATKGLFRDTGIPYCETTSGPESPEEEWRNDGSRVTRTFLVPWDRRHNFVAALVGYPDKGFVYDEMVDPDDPMGDPLMVVSGTYIQRFTPHAYEDVTRSDGAPYLFCTEVPRVQPWAVPDEGDDDSPGAPDMLNDDGVAQYGMAKVQAVYESLTYDIVEDDDMPAAPGYPDEATLTRYVTKRPYPASQGISIPSAVFYYVDSNPALPANFFVSKMEPKYDFAVTWHMVPEWAVGSRFINPETTLTDYPIDDCLGKVNDSIFINCDVATLLLSSVMLTPIRSVIGLRLWDIEYRFSFFRPGAGITHQHILFYNQGAGLIEYLEVSADNSSPVPTNLLGARAPGVNVYDYYEFRKLFRVPT